MPLTGVLPSRDSKISEAIVRMAKTNAILKRPVNKLFPTENTHQEPKEQKLRREAAVIGKL